jgi:hypothetical protein
MVKDTDRGFENTMASQKVKIYFAVQHFKI